jgi:hypothetical protein
MADVLHHSTQNFYRLYGKTDMTWESLPADTIQHGT